MSLSTCLRRGLTAACLVCGGPLGAQLPDPQDYDLLLRLDRESYEPGAAAVATTGVTARVAGIQGWSYGVRHDGRLVTIREATIEGTDVPAALIEPNFTLTEIIEDASGTQLGFVQGVVLSFIDPAEIPVTEFFSMARVTYEVAPGACEGTGGDVIAELRFVNDLGRPGNPPVDLTLTVGGRGLVPAVIDDGELRIRCAGLPGGLRLAFAPEGPAVLRADRVSTFDLEVHAANDAASGRTDLEAWSYGIALERELLEAVEGRPGADAAALNGGGGPDFTSYNLQDESEDGSVRGVSAGAVVALGAPGTEVLPVPAGGTAHLDTIVLRAAVVIPEGEPERETELRFVDQVLGRDRPLEILFVVAGDSVIPDFSDTKALTLQPGGVEVPFFIRADANNDARIDIGDGIWIVNMLFYGGPRTQCLAAADANGDTRVDLADALHVIRYQLQPGATSGSLFPPPPAPFPDCGSAAEVTLEECPRGSHTCSG